MLVVEGENMESLSVDSVPCLLEKALTMLISMGSGRPKTLKKLENVLRPCTAVVPYVDPLKVLDVANRRSTCPEPPVLNVQHNQKRVYYTPPTRFSDEALEESVLSNARWHTGRINYDLPLRGSETEAEIMQGAVAWLGGWETREGTQEELVRGLHARCVKKVDRTPLEGICRLQSRGFLNIQGDTVAYSLPDFDDEQSRCLKAVRLGASKSFSGMIQMLEAYSSRQERVDFSVIEWLLSIVYNLRGSCSFKDIERSNNGDEGPSHGIINPNATSRTVSGDGLEDVLRDVLMAYSLSSMLPVNRPSSLKSLLALFEPESIIFAVAPSQVLVENQGQIKHKQSKSSKSCGRSGKGKTEYVIGLMPGEIEAREMIPLTPEGLLGIDFHITQSPIAPPDPDPTPNERGAPMDSPPSWHPRDKLRANGMSKGFAALLNKQLSRRAKYRNAVPVLASERDKEEVVSRVLEWVGSYRSPGTCDDPDKTNSNLKSVEQIQSELIGLCAVRARQIAPASIVRRLQKGGYLTVHHGASPEVTYNIPAVKSRQAPTLKDAGKAPWQQQADDFRQAVSRCYSVYFKRAFPPKACKSPSRMGKMGKRRQLRGRSRRQHKKQRSFESSDEDDYNN